VRVEVIKASLLIRTTTVHYIIGVAWSKCARAPPTGSTISADRIFTARLVDVISCNFDITVGLDFDLR
jgi:hypothetical protein